MEMVERSGDGGGVEGEGIRLFALKCDRSYLNACQIHTYFPVMTEKKNTYLTHIHAVSGDISNEIGMCQNRSLWRSCRQDKKWKIDPTV